jgi:hypothetical protein
MKLGEQIILKLITESGLKFNPDSCKYERRFHMNYFVRFNQNANKVYAIHNFNEAIRAESREFGLQLKIEKPEEADALTSELSKLLEKNAVSKIEILNENEVVLFTSSMYTEAASLDVGINLNFNLSDTDTTNDKEIAYTLNFRTE